MPRKKTEFNVDLQPVNTLTHTLAALDSELKSERHEDILSDSAFAIMKSAFTQDTVAISLMQPEDFHHVYEPGHVGNPAMQLFAVKMVGRGRGKRITWDWRTSKVTVPTIYDANGEYRWEGANDKFDPERLNRVHIFVWRAPIMEYGSQVTVRPKLGKVLVYPNREIHPNSPKRGPIFTSTSYTFTPGAYTQGNFTTWFARWWGEGMAEQSLKQFEKRRDRDFKRSFEQRMSVASRTRSRIGSHVDTDGPARGKRVAAALRGDLEQNYVEQARKRRGTDDLDEE